MEENVRLSSTDETRTTYTDNRLVLSLGEDEGSVS